MVTPLTPNTLSKPQATIRRKLISLVLYSLGVATLLTAALSIWIESGRQIDIETQRLTQTARVLGSISADAVARGERGAAFGAIRSIAQMPNVTYARIRDRNGRLLAETGGGVRLSSDARLTGADARLSLMSALNTGTIEVNAPIIASGQTVGSITLLGRADRVRERVLSAVGVTLAGAGVALTLGLLIAWRMAGRISAPISALAAFTAELRRSQDMTRSADIKAEGEVADLVAGFNMMLDGVRERDRRIADQMAGLEGQVRARTAELSVAKEAAERANAAKSDFLAVMSHEIRTPLNGILALSELLATSGLPTRQQRHADVIAKSGRSLLAIINDILDFSKVEAGKLELEAIPFDLAEAAEDVASLFSARAAAKGLDLAVFVHPALTEATGDPTRLRQVLSNLVNNAIKFTETGGVLISVEPAQGGIRFAVSDTGAGIAADKLPTLFEAFTQADQSTTRHHGGTGLGLAICDRLVKAMDGAWRLESEVGAGSTFAFVAPLPHAARAGAAADGSTLGVGDVGPMTRRALELYVVAAGGEVSAAASAGFQSSDQAMAGPAVTVLAAEEDARSISGPVLVRPLRRADVLHAIAALGQGEQPVFRRAAVADAERAVFPGARVLVVDDGEVNLEVAREALSRLQVTTSLARSGHEAIERLRVERFDLVLMDGSMPELDGFEATRLIRREETETGRPRVVIHALTAHVVGAAATAWREADMDGVVHKPFGLDDLARVLRSACPHLAATGEGAEAQPEVLDDSDLFDPEIRGELLAMAHQGRADFLERVDGLYRENAPARLLDLVAAVGEAQDDAAARAAHALKSMSLSLGARAVADLCADFEDRARAGEPISPLELERMAMLVERTLTRLDGQRSEVADTILRAAA